MKTAIVEYHYVRNTEETRFQNLFALPVDKFERQVNLLSEKYKIIGMKDLVNYASGNLDFDMDTAVLTFDDGHLDHFTNVFPFLHQKNIKALFSPPFKAITERKVLDVNKIQLIMTEVKNIDPLIEMIKSYLLNIRNEKGIKSYEEYWEIYSKAHAYFYPPDIVFIKRLLQRGLPDCYRNKLINIFFKKYINIDERIISNELYMTFEQLKLMAKHGMYIGCHGFDHLWLPDYDENEIELEIDNSLDMLSQIYPTLDGWIMCYPYGEFNETVKNVIKNKGCVIAFREGHEIVDVSKVDLLEVPRIDTTII